MSKNSKVRCPYCGAMYDPNLEEHEPIDEFATATECLVIRPEQPHRRLRPDSAY